MTPLVPNVCVCVCVGGGGGGGGLPLHNVQRKTPPYLSQMGLKHSIFSF